MEESHLHQDSTTDDDGAFSSRSGTGSHAGDARFVNVDFHIEKLEDMSSTDFSDPKVQDLVQFVNRQSKEMTKEIDSAMSSTDDSDEDSLKRRGGAAAPVAASSLVASTLRQKNADPRQDIDVLKEKLRLLLADRKAQKEAIDAQQAEIASLRAAARSGLGGNTTLDVVVLQGEANELKREVAALKTRAAEYRGEADEKSFTISQLEGKVEKLLSQNDAQNKIIEAQNAKIARLLDTSFAATPGDAAERGGTIRKTAGGLTTTQNNTFEADFAALDAALGQIDTTVQSGTSPLTPDQRRAAELERQLSERNAEIASLTTTVRRLEALAFNNDSSSDAGQDRTAASAAASAAAQSQIRFLKETSDEQARTIQLQKSTIGSLKEEVELLTRQMAENGGNSAINAEKQKKVASQQRAESLRLTQQAEKLERDKAEFVHHLREFKAIRKELFDGTGSLTTGAGVPKSKYRDLRKKRDKYKRKDYRKNHDISAMQRRLLQNVDLLEVEDSQSSSETAGGASASVSVSDRGGDETRSQASSKSVQLVNDSSSEHGDSE